MVMMMITMSRMTNVIVRTLQQYGLSLEMVPEDTRLADRSRHEHKHHSLSLNSDVTSGQTIVIDLNHNLSGEIYVKL